MLFYMLVTLHVKPGKKVHASCFILLLNFSFKKAKIYHIERIGKNSSRSLILHC